MRQTLHGSEAVFEAGVKEVASGVWAWLQPNGSWGESNAGLVRGNSASALIDTLWDRRLTRRMLDNLLPRTTGAPLRWVINTHSDGDHWWGNGELPTDVEVITSEASLEAMRREGSPAAMARQRNLARLNARLPATTPGGFGLLGRYVSEMLAPFEFEAVGETRLPDRAFAETDTVELGQRRLDLIRVGPAHTAGDLIVHIPDAGVVFTADILFIGSTPVMWAGPVENWLRALKVLLSLDAETYVPGHGPVAGRSEANEVHDYLQWLQNGVANQHSLGASPLEAARALTRDPEFDRWRGWLCPERIVISATAEHRALCGQKPIPASVGARIRLFTQVAQMRQELHASR